MKFKVGDRIKHIHYDLHKSYVDKNVYTIIGIEGKDYILKFDSGVTLPWPIEKVDLYHSPIHSHLVKQKLGLA